MTALLLAPAGLFLGAAFLLPLAQLFRLSLGARDGPLAAYREVLGSVVYQRVFLNTLVVAFVVTVVCLLLAYPTAFVLSRLRGGLRAVAFYCVLVPFWISLLVRTYAWMLLLGTQGPVNAALVAVGLVSQPLPLLFNSTGMLIGMVHVLLPYAILPIYAAMVKVDERLLLASDGLGASPGDHVPAGLPPAHAPGSDGRRGVRLPAGPGLLRHARAPGRPRQPNGGDAHRDAGERAPRLGAGVGGVLRAPRGDPRVSSRWPCDSSRWARFWPGGR